MIVLGVLSWCDYRLESLSFVDGYEFLSLINCRIYTLIPYSSPYIDRFFLFARSVWVN